MLTRLLSRSLLAVVLGFTFVAAIPGGSIIVAILGISFLIFVHEWGHFYACKLTGTRTETFSIGFGPRLFGWEKDGEGRRRFTTGRRQLDPADHAMDFRIAAIPLGGYVKMAGEMPGEGGDGPPASDEFPAKSAWARTFIFSAGVIMNFITAIVFYSLAIAGEKPHRAPVVGAVIPGGPAWKAGLQPGDRVLSVGDADTPTWLDLHMEIAFMSADDPTPIVLERDGKRLPPIELVPSYNEERGILGVGIGRVTALEVGKDESAFPIGFDEAVTVAGAPVRGGSQALGALHAALDAGIDPVVVARTSGESFSLSPLPGDGPPEGVRQKGKVGIAPFAPPTVKTVRGRAQGILRVDDTLLSAMAAGEDGQVARVAISSEADARNLRFRTRLDSIRVLRAEREQDLEVGLTSQAAVVAFLGDVHLDSPDGNRIQVLPAGRTSFDGAHLWRYPSSPAADAGIPDGAHVVRIGDTVTKSWNDIAKAIAGVAPGEPLTMTVRAPDGPEEAVELRPIDLAYVGAIPVTTVRYLENWHSDGIVSSFGMGFSRTVRETKNVFRTIGALFTGNISFNKNIAGPITLVTASKDMAEDHWLQLVWFLAYVSVMLAVLNILPIPVLDGGHLMFILIEKVKGSKLKDETIYNFQKVGFLLLLVLMFFAFKNDFTRLFS